MFKRVIDFIRSLYPDQEHIPLHAPVFIGNEKKYVLDAIDSTFVSSVGEYVDRFEEMICEITKAEFAVATVNGTAALHLALKLVGVEQGDEVITQPISFVATPNAISYCGAKPVFLDVERETLGLDPQALESFLQTETKIENDVCLDIATGKRISACVPMHTFGHACKIDQIVKICRKYHIPVVEDAAEAIGSLYKEKHTGIFGKIGVLSFNGNKIVTCGGGGVIVTNDQGIAQSAKHLSTTAKIDHPYKYRHDAVGYNYRLPNLNAALACAQLENLNLYIENKRELAKTYQDFFNSEGISIVKEPANARSNYWLNAIAFEDRKSKEQFLKDSNKAGIQTRPVWQLLNKLAMYQGCQTDRLKNAQWMEERVVNIPSSVRV